jgi:hypothetical protein
MDWKQKVPGCFGLVDVEFARDLSDQSRAEVAVKAAQGAGASFDELEKEVVWHCYKHFHEQGRYAEHTAKQVATARRLWSNELRTGLTGRMQVLRPPLEA